MLTKIGLGLLVVVILLLIAIATRPATFRVERSTTIAAPAQVVFGLINDFHQWERWNPFYKIEPTQTVTLGGAPAGVGATYQWNGKRTGTGRMEILESRPHEVVKIKLDFVKPFKASNKAEFIVKPTPGGVSLTWAMSGDNTFVGKAISLFASMDKMVGKDFENGLADIKTQAESEASRQADGADRAIRGPGQEQKS